MQTSVKMTIVFLVMMLFAASGFAQEDVTKSDIWLESQLMTTYTLNEHLSPFDLDVDVKNGVAILGGKVESSVEKSLAGEIAKGTQGINKVKNNITIASKSNTKSDESDFRSKVNNASLAAKVKFNLLWNKDTSGLNIDVDVENGVANLKGTVASQAEKDLAVKLAQNTSGVKKVNSSLKVSSKNDKGQVNKTFENAKETVSDFWITTKAEALLLYDKNTDFLDIDASTENGVVTLTGSVTSKEKKDYAVSLVENMVHVKKVIDRLKVEK